MGSLRDFWSQALELQAAQHLPALPSARGVLSDPPASPRLASQISGTDGGLQGRSGEAWAAGPADPNPVLPAAPAGVYVGRGQGTGWQIALCRDITCRLRAIAGEEHKEDARKRASGLPRWSPACE